MKVNVKVDISRNKILQDERRKSKVAKSKLINEIVKDTTPYVPFRDGTLYQSAITNMRRYKDKIVWNGPYARFLYNGLLMVGVRSRSAWAKKGEVKETIKKVIKYGKKNPLAGYKWFSRSKAKNKQKWITFTKKVFKNG